MTLEPAPVKTLVVLQPGYLPWLGFFDQMRRADVFIYYDDVPFDKHGWRNRNRIDGGVHGWLLPLMITLPSRTWRLSKRLMLSRA